MSTSSPSNSSFTSKTDDPDEAITYVKIDITKLTNYVAEKKAKHKSWLGLKLTPVSLAPEPKQLVAMSKRDYNMYWAEDEHGNYIGTAEEGVAITLLKEGKKKFVQLRSTNKMAMFSSGVAFGTVNTRTTASDEAAMAGNWFFTDA